MEDSGGVLVGQAMGGDGPNLTRWSPDGAGPTARIARFEAGVRAVCPRYGGGALVVGERSGAFVLSRGASRLRPLPGAEPAVHAVATAAHAPVAVLAGTVIQLLSESGEPTTIPLERVGAVSLTGDGSRLVACDRDGPRIIHLDIEARAHAELEGAASPAAVVTVDADGRYAATVGRDTRGPYVWRLGTGERVELPRMFPHLGGYTTAAFGASGARLALGMATGYVKVLDLDSMRWLLWVESAHGSAVRSLAFTPDGRRLLSGGEDGRVLIWSLSQGTS